MPQHERVEHAAGGALTTPAGAPRRRGTLAVALVASATLVLAAPGIGSARSALRAAFPGTFSRLIEGGLALALLIALGIGVARIRTARVLRYAVLAIAIAAAWAYSVATGSADPAILAVERVHFVEYGAITWLFLRVWRDRPDASSLVAPVLAAGLVGIGDEAFQWFLPARVGELADVALNFVAIACGLAFGAALTPPAAIRGRWRGASIRLVTRLVAATIVALAAFVHVVHVGHRLEVPRVGTFESRYTAIELTSLDYERGEAWRRDPPLVRPPRFSREDQYMSEGLQHVQARNQSWASGDVSTALRENAILERYFGSVLDTPSYVSKSGHRWSPEQRADGERRAAASPDRPFESRAFPYPIFVVSPLLVWGVALGAALGVWLAGGWIAGRASARDAA